MKSVSVKEVIAKVFRDLNLKDTNRWVDFTEWAGEAVGHIGAFDQYVNKEQRDLEVKNFRAKLPCDFRAILQINYKGVALQYLGGSFDMSFHCAGSKNLTTKSRFGYRINGPYINTNFNNDTMDLAYQAYDTDEDGFPKIPDDFSYKEAVMRYIVYKLKYGDYVAGINGMTESKMERLEKDWHWYCGQARATLNMPNVDQLQAIHAQWVRLVPNINRHSDFFRELGNQEALNKRSRFVGGDLYRNVGRGFSTT